MTSSIYKSDPAEVVYYYSAIIGKDGQTLFEGYGRMSLVHWATDNHKNADASYFIIEADDETHCEIGPFADLVDWNEVGVDEAEYRAMCQGEECPDDYEPLEPEDNRYEWDADTAISNQRRFNADCYDPRDPSGQLGLGRVSSFAAEDYGPSDW